MCVLNTWDSCGTGKTPPLYLSLGLLARLTIK